MSEKEARKALELVKELTDGEGIAYKSDWMRIEFAIDKALASVPDVVVAMRKIVAETCKGTLSPEQVWAVGLIKRWIEEEFHVHLTDDGGWERDA